jgi:hypothetical protein
MFSLWRFDLQSVYVTQAPSGRLLYSQAGPPGHPPPQQGRYTVPGMQREMWIQLDEWETVTLYVCEVRIAVTAKCLLT